ncbi:MAG: peptidase T [Planctomycetaceae bacterium]
MPLLDRFLRYVRIDTQADEHSDSVPSTAKQLELSRLLARECEEMRLADVSLDEHGIVMATVPATGTHAAPAIAFVAHVDTSPEFSGTNVNPVVHENYQGGDIVLPGDASRLIRVAENPSLEKLIGATVVTTDGTTLLGADDKAGIAVIMSAAEHLLAHPEIPHGPVRLCFTCDEEIGRGVDHLDILAVVTVRGVNTHPSVGKDAMVNAIRILAAFLDRLPQHALSPETTCGREGFLHPYEIEGSVAEARARIILRDFETPALAEYAALLESIAAALRVEYPKAQIDIAIRKQYRNMRDGLAKEPRALPLAIAATRAAGLEPREDIIRGGTDGSRLTELGLPCPNLSTGQHNPHSPLEWTSVEEMRQAVNVLVELARLWGAERE